MPFDINKKDGQVTRFLLNIDVHALEQAVLKDGDWNSSPVFTTIKILLQMAERNGY